MSLCFYNCIRINIGTSSDSSIVSRESYPDAYSVDLSNPYRIVAMTSHVEDVHDDHSILPRRINHLYTKKEQISEPSLYISSFIMCFSNLQQSPQASSILLSAPQDTHSCSLQYRPFSFDFALGQFMSPFPRA